MELKTIYTNRDKENWPSWQIIHEWEDVYCGELNLSLTDVRKAAIATTYTDKLFRFISRSLFKSSNVLLPFIDKFIYKKPALCFELLVRETFYFTGSKNTIPIIIDFWKLVNLNYFYHAYKNCRAVLISSLEAYTFLKQNNCPLNIYHFPLSLPDKYKLVDTAVFNKVYDVIIPGRGNTVLWEYLLEYEKKFPGIEYLYQDSVDGELCYISNKSGLIGKFHDRETYMNLLKLVKVAFYSTPGIDGGEIRTGGFNPVTPRFLEILAAGCRVIARYPQNEESRYYEMDKICVPANDYPIFEDELNKALKANEPPVKQNAAYLTKHYTSAMVSRLKSILNEI